MILGPNKERLSKRHGATGVQEYQRDGYQYEGLLNYLAFLGWNPGTDEEIMNLLDISAVTFQCILTKSDKVNLEQKKHVLNQVRKKLQAHPAAFPELVVTSAENKTGLEGLRSIIATLD